MCGDALPLGDHPGVYPLPDALHIIQAFDPDIYKLDPILRYYLAGFGQDGSGDFLSTAGDLLLYLLLPLLRDLLQGLLLGDLPRGASDKLDQFAAGDLIPDHRIYDVVQAGLGAGFRGHVL